MTNDEYIRMNLIAAERCLRESKEKGDEAIAQKLIQISNLHLEIAAAWINLQKLNNQ